MITALSVQPVPHLGEVNLFTHHGKHSTLLCQMTLADAEKHARSVLLAVKAARVQPVTPQPGVTS